MLRLNPAVRAGLIWASAHQIILLCAAVSALVSGDLLTQLGVSIFLIDAPVALAGVLLRNAGYINWNYGGIQALPAEPLAALAYYVNAMAPFFLVGALQWFVIGYAAAMRRARRELQKRALQILVKPPAGS